MDDDGFFRVVDRKKELIIAGGFNIYPSEVEEVLLRLPEIREVAVVGLPDPRSGESVAAAVVLEPGAQLDVAAARKAVREALTPYKVPKRITVVDELPRYHLAGCRSLNASSVIPLPAREAVELGFTPCAWCTPDRALSARHRAPVR